MGVGLFISVAYGRGKGSLRHQKTKKAIILPVVIPIWAGIWLGSRSRDGQIDLSIMYMHEEPIMVLILPISEPHDEEEGTYPK
jgi:hypothetical protein